MKDINSVESEDIKAYDEKDKRCAPHVNHEDGSCFDIETLVAMANAYNSEKPKNPIKMFDNYEMMNPKKYKRHLVKEFNMRHKDIPQREWITLPFMKNVPEDDKEKISRRTFRPKGPEGRFEWLNTLHIDNVMKQYEEKYKEFAFLGTVPIDFDDFDRYGIKNIDYLDLIKKGKTKYGVIFNLDKHDMKGSHWVSLFADVEKGAVYFFDSMAFKPEPEIRKLIRRIARVSESEMNVDSENLIMNYNKTQHQFENSECGVYSINFILRMLRGDSFEEICESKIPDKKINKCRNVYFNNPKIK